MQETFKKYKVKVFVTALYIYVYLCIQLSYAFNYIMTTIMLNTPDFYIYKYIGSRTDIPNIIESKLINGNNNIIIMTNKIQYLISQIWDIDIGNNCQFDDNDNNQIFGGINLKELMQLYPILNDDILYISYSYNTTDINIIHIDFYKKYIYRMNNFIKPEPIKYNDIIF